MVLSTRVSLQWVPEKAEELTHTLVFTTPADRFVDVRVYKHQYPHVSGPADVPPFEEVFQWVIVGDEEPIPGTNQIRFNHTINSAEVLLSLRSKRPLAECTSSPDIGTFWPIEGSDDRKETGQMVNPSTGQMTEYVEIWRSLSPQHATFQEEVREGHGDKDSRIVSMAFDLDENGVSGRVVRLGNWVQGVVYDSCAKENPISVMRRVLENGQWRDLIRYGHYEFPEVYAEHSVQSAWARKE